MSLPVTLAAVRCIQVRLDVEHAQTRLTEAQAALHAAHEGRPFTTSIESRLLHRLNIIATQTDPAVIAAEIEWISRRRPH